MRSTPRERAVGGLRAYAPELADLAVTELRELGGGLDNVVFTAGELVVRVAAAGGVSREAELLRLIAPRVPIPVPLPRFADERAGVLIYALLPGRPLLGRRPSPGAARRLGEFLRHLHAVDPADVEGLVPAEEADPAEWLEDLRGPPDLLRVVRATIPPPSPLRVLTHADLGAEHILDLDGALTGVIDWSDAALTDPALDFARLYRDFGPAFLAEALDAYGGLAGAMPRVEFFARCAALEDLAFGRESGRQKYARAAQSAFAWLFPPT